MPFFIAPAAGCRAGYALWGMPDRRKPAHWPSHHVWVPHRCAMDEVPCAVHSVRTDLGLVMGAVALAACAAVQLRAPATWMTGAWRATWVYCLNFEHALQTQAGRGREDLFPVLSTARPTDAGYKSGGAAAQCHHRAGGVRVACTGGGHCCVWSGAGRRLGCRCALEARGHAMMGFGMRVQSVRAIKS